MHERPFTKMLLDGPAIHRRPWIDFCDEVLRWYDYWLKYGKLVRDIGFKPQ